MRHQIASCPNCPDIFVSVPGDCPDCGTFVPAPEEPERPERIVSYRLNRLAAAGGVAIGGLVTGAGSVWLGRPGLGIALLVAGLSIAALLLLLK